MGLIECGVCKKQISKNAEKCPNCAEPVPKKTSLLVVLLALFFIIVLLSTISNNNETETYDNVDNADERKKVIAKYLNNEKKKLKTEFIDIKSTVIDNINKFVKNKQDIEAVKLIEKYASSEDRDILELQKTVATDYYLKTLKKLPSSKLKENLELYKKLLSIYPNNDKYKKKVAFYDEKLKIYKNRNKTGIWGIKYYVDKFNKPTKTKYLTNQNDIQGVFSNTATQSSKLDVKLLIDNKNEISIKLYEYGNNLPVKGYSDYYDIYLKDRDGYEYVVKKEQISFVTKEPYIQKYTLTAYNNSDRLVCTKDSAIQIHKALLKGGNVEFYIKHSKHHSEYRFNVNAEYYNNAYRKLREK